MKVFFETIKSDKSLYFGFMAAAFFTLVNLAYIAISYPHLPPFFPLFNQLPWGEARIAIKWQIFIPPFIALLILLGNLIFSFLLYKKNPLLSRIVSTTALLVCFFALLFIMRTIQLII